MTQITNTSNSFKPSIYQQKILDWIFHNPTGNAVVNAVAGSGKSTTLKLIANALFAYGIEPSEIKIIVFGKQNSLDLIEKFGQHWKGSISTLHSIGYQILAKNLGRIKKVDSNKYKKLAQSLSYLGTPKNPGLLKQQSAIGSESQFLKLFNLGRLNLSDFQKQDLVDLASHHNLDEICDYKACSKAMLNILDAGIRQALYQNIIDYTDMIFVPICEGKRDEIGIETNTFVLVDECQDLNLCQRRLAMKLAGENGRLIFVGDPKQAIYGFSGASCDSFNQIKVITEAVELPLSVCYRCPTSHIELVNRKFPSIPIEPAKEAKEGIVEYLHEDEAIHQKGDLVLSRKTATLVSYCLKLIGQGIAAKVRGRDIGEALIKEINNIWEFANGSHERKPDIKHFLVDLAHYQELKNRQWRELEYGDKLIEILDDKLNAIEVIYNSINADLSIKTLEDKTKELFTESRKFVDLCTVHRAKGLEADRVFILEPKDMPLTWKNQLKWELEQENNLLYVALTRSRSELYFITQDDDDDDDDDDE